MSSVGCFVRASHPNVPKKETIKGGRTSVESGLRLTKRRGKSKASSHATPDGSRAYAHEKKSEQDAWSSIQLIAPDTGRNPHALSLRNRIESTDG